MNTQQMIEVLRTSDDPQKLAAADELNALLDEEAQLRAENTKLKAELAKLRVVTVARRSGGNLIACDGDGSGPGCEYDAEWEVQAMDADGSNYTHLCSDHLSDYQKWAADDGRLPMIFETIE